MGNGYNIKRKDERIDKNKEIEIKKTMASLIKRESAKYLNNKSGCSLKQKINILTSFSNYSKMTEEVGLDDVLL